MGTLALSYTENYPVYYGPKCFSFIYFIYKNINITLELQENKIPFFITLLQIITTFVIAIYKNSSIMFLQKHEKHLCITKNPCITFQWKISKHTILLIVIYSNMTSISCGRFHCTLYEVSFHILCTAVLCSSYIGCIYIEIRKWLIPSCLIALAGLWSSTPFSHVFNLYICSCFCSPELRMWYG